MAALLLKLLLSTLTGHCFNKFSYQKAAAVYRIFKKIGKRLTCCLTSKKNMSDSFMPQQQTHSWMCLLGFYRVYGALCYMFPFRLFMQ